LNISVTNFDKKEGKIKKDKKEDEIKKVESKVEKNNETIFQVKDIYQEYIKLGYDYLKKKNYSKALEYAKKANKIDNQRPDSWILSAKILLEKKEKKKAINILKTYYEFTKNKEVKRLLDEISN